MDEIERDLDVLANGWLAAVCLIAGLVAAFLFATWAVSCTAHAYPPPLWTPIGWSEKFPPPRPEGWVEPSSSELIPLDGVWAVDPDRPSHFIVNKTDKGTVVFDSSKGTFAVEPVSSGDPEVYDLTTTAAIKGLEDADSTGDGVDIQWNATATVIPGDGQVLMYDGTTLKWTTIDGSGEWSSVPPQGTTKAKKGGIMGFYFPIAHWHVFIIGFLGVMGLIIVLVYAAWKWVNDEPPTKLLCDGDRDPWYKNVAIFSCVGFISIMVASFLWPILYPAAAIVGALYGTRALIRLKKAVKGKSDIDHTHDEARR